MKKNLFVLILVVLGFSSCGDDSTDVIIEEQVQEVEKDSLKTIEGEFIFLSDAAVIKGTNFIYGVELDSISRDLAKQVAPLKNDDFDMIPVVVRAQVVPNPGRKGWNEFVRISEVIEIADGNAKQIKKTLEEEGEKEE